MASVIGMTAEAIRKLLKDKENSLSLSIKNLGDGLNDRLDREKRHLEKKINNEKDRIDKIEVLGGLSKGDVTDSQTSYLVSSEKSLTHDAVLTVVGSTSSAKSLSHLNVKNPTGEDINNIIDDMVDGEILYIPKDIVISEGLPIKVTKPVTISGGTYKGDEVFQVLSDHVTLDNLTVSGYDDWPPLISGNETISCTGTEDKHIKGFVLKNSVITNSPYHSVRVRYSSDFEISNNDISNFRYSGIAVGIAENGLISKNTIKHGWSDGTVQGPHNCYGIYCSSGKDPDEKFRSKNITIIHNYIEDIPHWEGIDTHNGQEIHILYNKVVGCRRSIALVNNNTSRVGRGVNRCKVIGNSVDGTGHSKENFKDDIGISAGGSSTGNRKMDVIITNNYVRGHTYPITFGDFTKDPNYNFDLCVVADNVYEHLEITSSLKKPLLPGTDYDSGWVEATEHFNLLDNKMNSVYGLMSRFKVKDGRPSMQVRGCMTFTHAKYFMRMKGDYFYRFLDSRPIGDRKKAVIGFTFLSDMSTFGFVQIDEKGWIEPIGLGGSNRPRDMAYMLIDY